MKKGREITRVKGKAVEGYERAEERRKRDGSGGGRERDKREMGLRERVGRGAMTKTTNWGFGRE